MKTINHPFQLAIFSLFIAIGLALLNQYATYPIVRNSIIYAAIIQGINETGLWQAGDFAQNKPLGFAIISFPFTQLWGVNIGLKVSSWFATVAYALIVTVFIRHLARFYSEHSISATKSISNDAILICLCNPLLFYQFISAYPDSLFAALFLATIISLHYTLSAHGHILMGIFSFLLIILSIWVKHHGLVLIPITLLMAIYYKKELIWQWRQQPRRLKFSILLLMLLIAVISDAYHGDFVLFNMAQNQSNFLGGADRLSIVQDNIKIFLLFCFISFNLLSPVLLVALFNKNNHSFIIFLLLLFILPILYYHGARYNIRYYIAIIPLLSWLIAIQIQSWPQKWRHIALGIFVLISLFISLYYHHSGFYHRVQAYVPLPNIDNLRLVSEQETEKQNLATIQQYAGQYDNTLIYYSNYYTNATFGVWEKAGIFPAELNIHYFQQGQKESLIQLNIPSAIVYEYIGVGQAINPMVTLSESSEDIKKLNPQLYLWDRKHKL